MSKTAARIVELITLLTLVVVLFNACTYAMDNDPNFSGSNAYEQYHSREYMEQQAK